MSYRRPEQLTGPHALVVSHLRMVGRCFNFMGYSLPQGDLIQKRLDRPDESGETI